MLIFRATAVSAGTRVKSMAIPIPTQFGFGSCYLQVACMNELGNVVSRGQANVNRMLRPRASIIIFQPSSQGVSSDADDGIHLWVKRFRASNGVYRNAVLFNFADCSFEVLLTNICQKSNMIVGPPEDPGRQDVLEFSPLRFKLADCRLQVDTPKPSPSTHHPLIWGSITQISPHDTEPKHLQFQGLKVRTE